LRRATGAIEKNTRSREATNEERGPGRGLEPDEEGDLKTGSPRGGRRRTLTTSDGGWMTRCRKGRTVDALAPAAEEGRSHAAKRSGEGLAPGDPEVSEWGNPAAVMGRHPTRVGREPGELKHLSTSRKREDSRSSGERNGRSPNHSGVRASRRCLSGVERDRGRGRLTLRSHHAGQPKCPGTAHRRG
jgi:hypothetical protein